MSIQKIYFKEVFKLSDNDIVLDTDIIEIRKEIDKIDSKIVEILNERANYAKNIGSIKKKKDYPIFEGKREKLISERIEKINSGPLSTNALLNIYSSIIKEMREIQKEE